MIGRKGRDVPLHSKEVGTKEVNLHGVLTMDEKDSVPWSMNLHQGHFKEVGLIQNQEIMMLNNFKIN